MIKLVLGAIIGIIAIGSVVSVSVKNRAHGPNSTTTPAISAGSKAEGKFKNKTSIADLLGSASAQECTFSTTTPANSSTGTLYVSGGKMRANVAVNTKGAKPDTYDANMIYDGSAFYLWTSVTAQGIKIAVPASELSSPTTTNALNLKEKIDYECTSWTPKPEFFVPPTTVQFGDIQQQIQQQLQKAIPKGTDATKKKVQ